MSHMIYHLLKPIFFSVAFLFLFSCISVIFLKPLKSCIKYQHLTRQYKLTKLEDCNHRRMEGSGLHSWWKLKQNRPSVCLWPFFCWLCGPRQVCSQTWLVYPLQTGCALCAPCSSSSGSLHSSLTYQNV